MKELVTNDNVLGFISLHSYSQVLLVPMTYTRKRPENYGRNDTLLVSLHREDGQIETDRQKERQR